jgi:hypothetical protein
MSWLEVIFYYSKLPSHSYRSGMGPVHLPFLRAGLCLAFPSPPLLQLQWLCTSISASKCAIFLAVEALLLAGRVEVALDIIPALSTVSLPDLCSPSGQHCLFWRLNLTDYLCISTLCRQVGVLPSSLMVAVILFNQKHWGWERTVE